MALIKREILTSREVVYTTQRLARVISSLFCKKEVFQRTDFSRLKCQLKRKKLTKHVLERFCKFQPTREWVNKVNLWSFQLENVFRFVLA